MNDKRKPAITIKYKITGKLELHSPLLIGSGKTDGVTAILVQKNRAGKPLIPGSSIAGVLRTQMLSDTRYCAIVNTLFGRLEEADEHANQSAIIIEDIILTNGELVERDGVCIDYCTGIAKDKGKYDFEVVERGANGALTIFVTVRGWQENSLGKNAIDAIAATLSGGIFLGAKTSKGLGHAIVTNLKVCKYDFSKLADIKAWLYEIEPTEVYQIQQNSAANPAELVVEAQFALLSSLIVRSDDISRIKPELYNSDKSDEENNKKAPDTAQLRSGTDFVIPGTSIKGVLRNQSEKIFNIMGKDHRHLIQLMGQQQSDNNAENKLKSRLLVHEVYIQDSAYEGASSQIQYRNKIDRFTNAVIDSALFSNVPIVQIHEQPTVNIRMGIREPKTWEVGLVLLLLKDLWTGQIALGGEKSIGRGRLKGVRASIQYQGENYVLEANGTQPDLIQGNPADLEKLVQEFVKLPKAGEQVCV